MKQKNYYIDRNELKEQILKWQNGEKDDRLGELIMLACEKILGHSNFRNYTYTLKEDMKSHAVWRVIQNLKNFKKEMSSTKFFNYLTTCIFCAYIQVIKQYYKDLKLQKQLEDEYKQQFCEVFGVKLNDKHNKYDISEE